MSIIIDISSVERFADNGLTALTSICFPNKPYSKIELESGENILLKNLEFVPLKNIWNGITESSKLD